MWDGGVVWVSRFVLLHMIIVELYRQLGLPNIKGQDEVRKTGAKADT